MDRITVVRVANGWIIATGQAIPTEFTHVAASPEEVADHVRKWALATQTEALTPPPHYTREKGDHR